MKYIQGQNRSQTYLFPDTLDDAIGATLIAGDSTKFRAQNSKKNNFSQKPIAYCVPPCLQPYTIKVIIPDLSLKLLMT